MDDGEEYARLIAERMPEVELVEVAPGEPRAADGPSALAFLARHAAAVDLVLLDVNFDVAAERLLPLDEGTSPRRVRRFQGVAILRALRLRHPGLPVVLLTSLEDLSPLDGADELAGLSLTYFLEADDLDTLRIRIHAALQDAAAASEDGEVLWGRAAAMRAVRSRLGVLAHGRFPVIVEGETGTGKSYLAERFIHARSGRPGPFVTLDLAAVPEGLAPAQLFGARRGAYTGAIADRPGAFQAADHGTLFLDEVQNIPLEVQKQLLVVLQEGRVRALGGTREEAVDVKVVAASNSPLAEAVAAGRFRHDLYMRLSPATRVVLPPLRERRGDLSFLAARLLGTAAREADLEPLLREVARALGVPPEAGIALGVGRSRRPAVDGLTLAVPRGGWELLERHDWPGNLRELATVMRNLLGFTLVAAADALRQGVPVTSPRLQVDTGLIAELLAAGRIPAAASGAAGTDGDGGFRVRIAPAATLSAVAADLERQAMLALFERTAGSFPRMAELLLGDVERHRAVRLRFNQLGLKVRELKRR